MKILITGSAGFIGFHLSKLLLEEGFIIHGYDGMTDYYDVNLKNKRNEILEKYTNFTFTIGALEDGNLLETTIEDFRPEIIVHLAAQAGVRYSLENPRAYIDSNVVGTFNVIELARKISVKHLLIASTSSVYGANKEMPFIETEKADTQLTIYSASKKANESMAHAYAHLYNLPTTIFRFFTVYGPWGRPDLALYKFVDAILDERPIDIYNHGNMYRDFTYVDDLVNAIRLLINVIPQKTENNEVTHDSLSPVAPYRIVNIGNSDKIKLLDFVEAIEECLGKKAQKNFMEIQAGDVPATWANAELLKKLTGYSPNTNFRDGISKFVEWYREYYKK
ncbi:GDP-mannose 4,6-dehydratase [Gammaproteobacteria bacterium]|nr:GDP-mannose 4,6-dehydratase [Gammaproteobacteria bacterium]